jgi:NAD(P) transhydrogenase subunit alpha
VLLGAGNVAGGFAVTQRMLAMFQTSGHPTKHPKHAKRAAPAAVKSISPKKA